MAVFSPTNAKVHFKAYDGSFADSLSNTGIVQNHGVTMDAGQTLFGQTSMYMADFKDSITFSDATVFDVVNGDYSVGFWFYPTQFTSWDRLFCTDDHEWTNPLRIYNHNGSINVFAESNTDGTSQADALVNYHLSNLDGANHWYHIMVRRESGTTKLYINGVERDSSTMDYTLNNAGNPTLGADINAAVTGVKGYIQDFFWTEDAISFTQADFTPATAEPITFHSGNPSISSFSTSAASVAESGDSVTLSWSVSGETKLELLKYVGGILSSTEDVLGLSSKLVAITETVSYKLRATNDNSAVDSASVQIQLSQGGNNMSLPTSPVVIQGSHLADKLVADAIVVSVDGAGVADSTLGAELAGLVASDASATSDRGDIRSEFAAADAAIQTALDAQEAKEAAYEVSNDAALAALQADVDGNESDSDAAHTAATSDRAAVRSEFAAADAAIQTALDAQEAKEAAYEVSNDAALAALQADVDGNESDSDAAHTAATSDRGDIRSEFAAADAAIQTALDAQEAKEAAYEVSNDAALAALQADVDGNESDSDAAHTAATSDRGDIRSEFAAADVSAASFNLTAREAIQADVDQNEADADAAIAAEEARALAAEGVNATAISAEETRALAAEGVLTSALAQEVSDRDAADVSAASFNLTAREAIQADVDQNEADADAAIAAEEARALAAEGVNATAISAEETRALAAEGVLAADIAVNLTKIGNEEARALAAEVALGSRMDSCLSGDGTEVFTKLLLSDGSVAYKMYVNASGELKFELN